MHVVNFAIGSATPVEGQAVPGSYAFFDIFSGDGGLPFGCRRGARRP
jgi:hypothetical protein